MVNVMSTDPIKDWHAHVYFDAASRDAAWALRERIEKTFPIEKIVDYSLVDAAAKQLLLEADGVGARCELLVQLMQFFGRSDPDEARVTLQ